MLRERHGSSRAEECLGWCFGTQQNDLGSMDQRVETGRRDSAIEQLMDDCLSL